MKHFLQHILMFCAVFFLTCFGILLLGPHVSEAATIVFTTTGTTNWTVPPGVTGVSVLVVAGGGGGGGSASVSIAGGGGGGGGVVYSSSYSTTPGASITVTVGAGGAGATGFAAGTNGGNSVFGTLTATGGGYGGTWTVAPATGGSGGAAGENGQSLVGAAGTAGQGFGGGNGGVYDSGAASAGGGGGGAGAAGANHTSNTTGGAGGAGFISSITGTGVYYGGGGGGAGSTAAGAGGAGGGGAGRGVTTGNGTNGTANTGGGGGGALTNASEASGTGGAGGSGIVIVTYSTRTIRLFGSIAGVLNTTFLTSGTSFTVPADWNNNNNTIEVIGGGGTSAGGHAGAGGGGYSQISNLPLTPGASVVYQVGAGGATGSAGGDSFFNRTSGSANTCADTVSVCAKGGSPGSGSTPGSGGAAASGVGAITFSGGGGGSGAAAMGGGGGAAGPKGPGGQAGTADATGNGGAGGGGGNGGGTAGSNNTGTTGGAGGANAAGSGAGAGGAPATNGSPGTAGGGGGGAGGSTSGTPVGGAGGAGIEWDATHGSGGGGGGGSGAAAGKNGGPGGLYGGGGGAGAIMGAGAQGIIVIKYAVPVRSLRLIGAAPVSTKQVMIAVNHNKVGSGITNFPVYIDLSTMPAQFWANVSSGCGDIRVFASDKTTELPREVVTCSTGSKTGELWFKAPTLSNTSDSIFFISYGSGASDYATNATFGAQNVWDTNYKGVWHLPNGSSLSANDSTSNANNGSITSATAISGELDGAASFNGSSAYIAEASTPTTVVNNWTLEAWINPAALSLLGLAIYNGNDSGGYGFGIGSGTGTAGSKLQGLFGSIAWVDSGYTFPSASQWYDVVMVRDSGTTKFYVNGVQMTGTSASVPNTPSATFSIGMEYNGSNVATRFFNGIVDEGRISASVRSTDWITTEYNNQSAPTAFYTATPEYKPLVKVFAQ